MDSPRRKLGIPGYLGKPVRQSELLDAKRHVLGGEAKKESAALVTRHSLKGAKKRARVLLAEDNAVNRALAIRLLPEMDGFEATAKIRELEKGYR
jgi:DNA-binding NarL/FixJ family response regulator